MESRAAILRRIAVLRVGSGIAVAFRNGDTGHAAFVYRVSATRLVVYDQNGAPDFVRWIMDATGAKYGQRWRVAGIDDTSYSCMKYATVLGRYWSGTAGCLLVVLSR